MWMLPSVFHLPPFGGVGLSRSGLVKMLRVAYRDVKGSSLGSGSLNPCSPVPLGHGPACLREVDSNLSIFRLFLAAAGE